jgi:hypothetical protein
MRKNCPLLVQLENLYQLKTPAVRLPRNREHHILGFMSMEAKETTGIKTNKAKIIFFIGLKVIPWQANKKPTTGGGRTLPYQFPDTASNDNPHDGFFIRYWTFHHACNRLQV